MTTDENGLYYMRQRYYSPELKRFVNQDVLTGNMGNSQSLNRYSYVQGNPVSYTDPFGLSPLSGLFTGTTFWHALLGLLGCVPGVVDVVENLADAAIYAFVDHDYFMASLSLVGAVTMRAGGVAKLAAQGLKLARGATYVYHAGMFVSNTMNFVKNSKEVYDIGSMMWQKYKVEGQEFGRQGIVEAVRLGFAAVGSVVSARGMAKFGKDLYGMMKADGVFAKIGQVFRKTNPLNGLPANQGYNSFRESLHQDMRRQIKLDVFEIRMEMLKKYEDIFKKYYLNETEGISLSDQKKKDLEKKGSELLKQEDKLRFEKVRSIYYVNIINKCLSSYLLPEWTICLEENVLLEYALPIFSRVLSHYPMLCGGKCEWEILYDITNIPYSFWNKHEDWKQFFKKIISEIICNKNYLNEINEGYVHHFKAFALEEE